MEAKITLETSCVALWSAVWIVMMEMVLWWADHRLNTIASLSMFACSRYSWWPCHNCWNFATWQYAWQWLTLSTEAGGSGCKLERRNRNTKLRLELQAASRGVHGHLKGPFHAVSLRLGFLDARVAKNMTRKHYTVINESRWWMFASLVGSFVQALPISAACLGSRSQMLLLCQNVGKSVLRVVGSVSIDEFQVRRTQTVIQGVLLEHIRPS